MSVPSAHIKNSFKRDCEDLAEFMEELMPVGSNPYVFDEQGRPMTREQIIARTRGGWKEEARHHGWSDEEIRMMVE
jgi:hypothetical protein